MSHYPNISDHGLIGDLQTAALVSTDGVLDWFCCPRFDSPSVFASLLDADKGGFYRIAPDRDDYVTRQLYLPDTAILVTRFMTPDGVGEASELRDRLAKVRDPDAPGASALTGAELRLLPMLCTHLSVPEIGSELVLSPHTIKSRMKSIYRKLGATSRSQAVTRARELGLVET